MTDADPLPDADGWITHIGSLCLVDPETEVEIKTTTGQTHRGLARNWQWDGGSITHYRIVRPAPSGPVVEETVKRIVPGVYGIVAVGAPERGAEARRTNLWLITDAYGFRYYTRSELLAAAETLRQIGEAMEGK